MNRIKKLLLLMMVLSIACALLASCGDPEKKAAKDAFKAEKKRIEAQIDDRDDAIKAAEESLQSKEKALDDTIKPALKKAIEVAEADEIKFPSMPSEIKEIKAATEKLASIDLSDQITDIKNMTNSLDKSRKQYKLLINPKESFIVKRLGNVASISNIKAVTEETDVNGLLNKSGGYTAAVYFSSPLVPDEYGLLTGDSIEDGTDGGGSIEVFKTVSEANSRNEYLGAFDGGILSSGSHTVYGTIIIRTSCDLTASQQKALEQEILAALTKL